MVPNILLGLCLGAVAFVATLTNARETSPAGLKARHAAAFEKQAKALRRTGEFEKRAPEANIKNITFSNPKASGASLYQCVILTEANEGLVV